MWLVLLAVVVAVWAAWVAYTVTQEGGVPFATDNTSNLQPKPDDTWPFPKDRL